jgi:hypothetical protein
MEAPLRDTTPFLRCPFDLAMISDAFRCFDSISGAEMIEIPTLARFKAPTSFVPSKSINEKVTV